MLSRNLKRALLDTRWPIPPPFLLPWAANLSTSSQVVNTEEPSSMLIQPRRSATPLDSSGSKPGANPLSATKNIISEHSDLVATPLATTATKPQLSSSVLELLPLLHAQGSHYITIHIHGKPYLVTQGDTLRLPFIMHGVEPGDILRLNCASLIGSRDFTLKPAAAPTRLRSTTNPIKTTSMIATVSHNGNPTAAAVQQDAGPALSEPTAPHFIPHIAKGKISYLDENLFVCRAVVMGVESEPLQIVEKTKRRQRKVKKVMSKHRFTVLKIKEVRVKDLEEIEGESSD